MNKAQKKFMAGSVIIVLSIGFLIVKGINASSHYYYTIPEVMELGPKAQKMSIRLDGKVAPGSLVQDTAKLEFSFNLTDDSMKIIPVDYEGIDPGLKDDLGVIVEGTLDEKGRLMATQILPKCPSRYDAAKEMKESS